LLNVDAVEAACPACSGTDSSASAVASEFKVTVAGKTFRQPEYEVRGCTACGLHFKSRRLSDADLADYYAQLPFESFESERLMPTDRLIMAAQNRLPAGSRILDFGCGVGRSLSHSVPRHECFGVEPNARAAEIARARGITILRDEDLDTRHHEFFDMIVLSDVYEHLTKPAQVLERMRGCLKLGGTLVLVTGLVDNVQPRQLLSEHWYFRVLGHLYMVSELHLRWIARTLSLRLTLRTALSHYDRSWIRDSIQHLQSWAYVTTHCSPTSAGARLVRSLPVMRRAALWNNAPMLTCGKDHVFATFTRPEALLEMDDQIDNPISASDV